MGGEGFGAGDGGEAPVEDVDVGVGGGGEGEVAEFLVDAGDGFAEGYCEVGGGEGGDEFNIFCWGIFGFVLLLLLGAFL